MPPGPGEKRGIVDISGSHIPERLRRVGVGGVAEMSVLLNIIVLWY
jgi:hypothetical protein